MTALIGPHNDDDADETGLPADVAGPIAYMLAGALVGVVAIGAMGWLVIRAPLQDWTTFTSPLFTLVATMVGYHYGRRDS